MNTILENVNASLSACEEEKVAGLVPLDLVDFELELVLCPDFKGPCIDKGNLVGVPKC